jgi:c-di-GMP-binding flagellar brake protein YcgR
MQEHRGFVRLRAPVDATYTVLPDGRPQRTLTRDVSLGGVRLVMEKPLQNGAQLQLALALPGQERPVNATGEVVWSEEVAWIGRADERRSAEVGVRTLEMAPQDQETLTSFIADGLRRGIPS